ncbi:NmrA/HSCARG family protein [Bradyrhizobium genosp. L]|uniref:NmrA/HSCARG family protein n=1 Tax=Bradyrhizobium genosp. L TaxID=83637 RepID=UPI0018A2FBA1|nr:NmrA/HSCARG family protein [Bradyrhizobium genosp. L]QPF87596.1 NmrA/HSCARG family protein [Bradyrhizobium genosp. L]
MSDRVNSERIVLVTGATGQQGGAVYRHLQNKGYKLRALVRYPDSDKARRLMGHGGDVFQGSLDDPGSLMRAMDGVYGVFSVQTYTENETQQGVAVIDAAKRQGVSHVVYSSVGSADEKTGIPHFESKVKVEEHLRASGLRYTILRPVFFMENWLRMFGYWGEPIRNGQVRQPLSPTTNLQMVAVDDIGAFAALAFEHPGKWENRTFSLAGDELSMQQIADAFSRATARDVTHAQVPWDQFATTMGRELTVMYRWFEDKGFHFDIEQARREYPPTHTFDRWLGANWSRTAAATR